MPVLSFFFFFQAEDGIRDLVRSRGLGDVYKRQAVAQNEQSPMSAAAQQWVGRHWAETVTGDTRSKICLLYTSDAADERSSVDLGGRRIIKKKKKRQMAVAR